MHNDGSIDPVRRAFVTGASTGIGTSIAVALAHDGYEVVLSGRNVPNLQHVNAEIEAFGGRSHIVSMDLSDPSGIAAAFETTWNEIGSCNALVNCGGSTIRKPATEITVEEWDEIINTNLRGTFLTSSEFSRRLIAEKHSGSIVNVGSTHGIVGFNNLSVYGISKAGVHHMTRMLAIEWAELGIRVNAVAPGATETPSRAEVFRDPVARKRVLDRIPNHRFTTTDEIAAAVTYLLSPSSQVITGHVLVLDGGLTVY